MEVLNNVDLTMKNTFHIKGIAEKYYYPENENDLIELMDLIKNEECYILSGGSNILINDKKIYKHIIDASKIDTSFVNIDNNIFYIGASLRIQEVINKINDIGYGRN